jgi:hypothetical protein
MPWVKIDDGFFDNPTNRDLGSAGRDLFLAGLCYCAKGLTDGHISRRDLPLILAQAQVRKSTVTKLIEAGRWIDRGDHLEVAEYLTYQPSRARVEADREAAKERQRRARTRSHAVTPTVTNGVTHAPPDPTRPPTRTLTSSSPGTPPRPDLKPVSAVLAERPERPPSDELLAGVATLREHLHPTTDDAA